VFPLDTFRRITIFIYSTYRTFNWKPLDINDLEVQRFSDFAISEINKLTKPYRKLCDKLSLKSVLRAQQLLPEKSMLGFKKSIDLDGYAHQCVSIPALTQLLDFGISLNKLIPRFVILPIPAPVKSKISRNVGCRSTDFAISEINKLTEPYRKLCDKLSLKSVLRAQQLLPEKSMLGFKKTIDLDGFHL
jgi:hypothetical protein